MPDRSSVVDRWRATKARGRTIVARNWNRWPFRQLDEFAVRYLHVVRNQNNNLEENGEIGVLRGLKPDSSSCLFDVGANRGAWTAAALRCLPRSHVVCVEPHPDLVDQLHQRFAHDGRVSIHGCALSDTAGTAPLYLDPRDSSGNSLVVRGTTTCLPSLDVPVRTGDQLLTELGVDVVWLLKVDAEGHDLAVIRGFARALGTARIDAIQFEYNWLSIFSRTFLRDYYDFLGPFGFVIGKIRPNGVVFKDYDASDEDWVGPDCLAVHRRRADLIARLRTG